MHLKNDYSIQSYWDWLPKEIQDYIITLGKCKVIYDKNKETGFDKVLAEIRSYGRLKEAWGHGHIAPVSGSWKPPGYYFFIVANYQRHNWWLGVDCALDEALINLRERRMTGEYRV